MKMTQDDFADIVKSLGQHREFQAGAWSNVIAAARQYAMLKAFNSRLENGIPMQLTGAVLQSATKLALEALENHALIAVRTDALSGAALLQVGDVE